jgi:hypothetical protein
VGEGAAAHEELEGAGVLAVEARLVAGEKIEDAGVVVTGHDLFPRDSHALSG